MVSARAEGQYSPLARVSTTTARIVLGIPVDIVYPEFHSDLFEDVFVHGEPRSPKMPKLDVGKDWSRYKSTLQTNLIDLHLVPPGYTEQVYRTGVSSDSIIVRWKRPNGPVQLSLLISTNVRRRLSRGRVDVEKVYFTNVITERCGAPFRGRIGQDVGAV